MLPSTMYYGKQKVLLPTLFGNPLHARVSRIPMETGSGRTRMTGSSSLLPCHDVHSYPWLGIFEFNREDQVG